jgi:hypothetical protein
VSGIEQARRQNVGARHGAEEAEATLGIAQVSDDLVSMPETARHVGDGNDREGRDG